MADTTYVDFTQPAINAAWLNEINDHVWSDTPVTGSTVHSAEVISVSPTGNLASTNVQDALVELQSDVNSKASSSALSDHVNDTTNAHAASSISFLQSGTDAVTRTTQNKLRDYVSVKDFGAIGDGVADDTAAVQNFFNAVTGGAVGIINSGDYLITSMVTVTLGSKGFTCIGAGVESARFIAANTFAATPVIKIVGSGNQPGFQMSGFSVRPSSSGSGSATVGFQIGSDSISDPVIAGFNTSAIKNVFISDFPICWKVIHARLIRFEDCSSWYATNTNLLIEQTGLFTADLIFDRCQFVSTFTAGRSNLKIVSNTGPYSPVNGNGSVAGIKFRSCDFYAGDKCIWFSASSSAWISDVWFVDGCQIDQETNYCVYAESNNTSAVISDIHFDGMYTNKSNQASFAFASTGTGGIVKDIWIDSCAIYNSQSSAIRFFGAGCQSVHVSDNHIIDCAVAAGAISFNGTKGVVCTGNRVIKDAFNVAPYYLVDILSGTTAIVCTGNNAAGVVLVTPIRDESGDVTKIIDSNPGYNPIGQKNITVTASPFTYKNTSGAAEYVYVSGGTISNVTINGAFGVVAATNNCWLVPQGRTITITYTVAPTVASLGA